jgi:hypothetical protein
MDSKLLETAERAPSMEARQLPPLNASDPRFQILDQVKRLLSGGKQISESHKHVIEVEDNVVIKHGFLCCRSEALAMQFITETTAIPVPRVYAYLSNGETPRRGYIAMEKLPGVALVHALDDLDDDACGRIAQQLSGYIDEMKKLDSPDSFGMVGKYGAYHGGVFIYLHSYEQRKGDRPGNPCKATNMREFLDYFALSAHIDLNDKEAAGKFTSAIDFNRPFSFSHGDLLPENIMYNPNTGNLVGLVDWQFAGWYPYFWNDWVARNRRWAYDAAKYATWKKIFERVFESTEEASSSFGNLAGHAELMGAYDSPYQSS